MSPIVYCSNTTYYDTKFSNTSTILKGPFASGDPGTLIDAHDCIEIGPLLLRVLFEAS